MNRQAEIYKVTLWGFALNAALFCFKFIAGIVGRSGAMVADAVHSASDFATDIVVLVFVRISSKSRDEFYDYGYGKYETVATIIIGIALAVIGIGIGVDSTKSIYAAISGEQIARPSSIALWAAGISIISKEIMYQYTVRVGRAVNSMPVIANAWHHRSDALSSVGTFIGIGLALFMGDKWTIADPIAALVVAVLILKVSYNLIKDSFHELVEKTLPKDIEDQIIEIIEQSHEVECPHNLRTRKIGSSIAIDVHVRVDGNMTVAHSHEIITQIERNIKSHFGASTYIIIHVEPKK